MVTAETEPALPSDPVAAEDGSGAAEAPDDNLLTQMQLDPAIAAAFANIPSWVFTGLGGLEDTNGFGFVVSAATEGLTPPDPAVEAFQAQLAANVGGPFVTTLDPGFFAPLTTQAYCNFEAIQYPGLPCGPVQTVPATTDGYAFSYTLDYLSGSTALVNVNYYFDNVTEQQTVPEPSTWAMMMLGFAGLGYAGYRRRQKFAGAVSFWGRCQTGRRVARRGP